MKTRHARDRKRRRERHGVAAVEFAVCLPLLLLLTSMTIEACNLIQLKHSLSVAAYEGARTAVLKGADTSDVRVAVKQVLKDRQISGSKITLTPASIRSTPLGQYIAVTVSARSTRSAVLQRLFDTELDATVSMMKEYD